MRVGSLEFIRERCQAPVVQYVSPTLPLALYHEGWSFNSEHTSMKHQSVLILLNYVCCRHSIRSLHQYHVKKTAKFDTRGK